jgi:hypothetical protein
VAFSGNIHRILLPCRNIFPGYDFFQHKGSFAMTARELVKAALAPQETDRVPYCILTCGETNDEIKKVKSVDDVDAWLDNDVAQVRPTWRGWKDLAAGWQDMIRPGNPRRRSPAEY